MLDMLAYKAKSIWKRKVYLQSSNCSWPKL